MSTNTNEQLLQKLKKLNIYDSISEIYIKNGRASCCVELPTDLLNQIEDLQNKIEATLLEVDGINSAQISFTSQRKIKRSAPIKPIKEKSSIPLNKKNLAKYVLAVASGKGGVGKSTCAVNLAKAMSSLGLKVGLLDLDVYGPSIPYLLKLETQQPETINKTGKRTILPLNIDNIEVMSIGFFIKPENAVAWRGHMASSFVKQMIHNVAWGELDILIVDMPPGTGDIQITLTQLLNLNGAIIVSTPHDLALLDARRCLDMFNKTNIPVLGLIENMSYFIAPDNGHIYHIFGEDGVKKEAEQKNLKLLGQLPLQNNLDLTPYVNIAKTIMSEL